MENKSHALAAGAFVLLVTAIVVALASWLSRDTKMRDTYELSTRESVTGLSAQAPVRYRGIDVGRVDAIGFDPKVTGNVLVKLAIDETTPLTSSTYAMLGFQGVTGLAYIQLDDSGESKQRLATTAEQPTRIPLRTNLLTKLTEQGSNVLVQVEETTQRLNQLFSMENQKILLDSVKSAGQSAAQIGAMSQRLQAIADAQFGPQRTDIPALVKDTSGAMRALQATSSELNKTAQETSRAASAATTAITTLSGRLNEKDGVLDQVGAGGAAIAQGAQTFNANTLPRWGRAADNTSKTARNAERVFNTIGDNPQGFIFGNGAAVPAPGEPGFVPPAR